MPYLLTSPFLRCPTTHVPPITLGSTPRWYLRIWTPPVKSPKRRGKKVSGCSERDASLSALAIHPCLPNVESATNLAMSLTCAPSPATQPAATGVGDHMSLAPTISYAKLTPTKWGENAIVLTPVSFANKQDTRVGIISAQKGELSQRRPLPLPNIPAPPKKPLQPQVCPSLKSLQPTTQHHPRLQRIKVKARHGLSHLSQPNERPPQWTTSQSASNHPEPNLIERGPRNELCIRRVAPPV
jgi:hypothetical protein